MNQIEQQSKAKRLLDLHHGPDLLILPNIWDPLGACLLQHYGYPAAATASAAVAFSQAIDDGERIAFTRMLEIISSIADAVDIPVTADIEAGYAASPSGVAENMRKVLHAGAVGINFEDTYPDSNALRPIQEQCDRISAIRSMAEQEGIHLVINARVDVCVADSSASSEQKLADTIIRAKAYREAGADCIYPLLLEDLTSLKRLSDEVHAPLNVYGMPSLPPVKDLLAAGVKRLSLGPGLLKTALAHMRKVVLELKATGNYEAFTRESMSSDEVRKILRIKSS